MESKPGSNKERVAKRVIEAENDNRVLLDMHRARMLCGSVEITQDFFGSKLKSESGYHCIVCGQSSDKGRIADHLYIHRLTSEQNRVVRHAAEKISVNMRGAKLDCRDIPQARTQYEFEIIEYFMKKLREMGVPLTHKTVVQNPVVHDVTSSAGVHLANATKVNQELLMNVRELVQMIKKSQSHQIPPDLTIPRPRGENAILDMNRPDIAVASNVLEREETYEEPEDKHFLLKGAVHTVFLVPPEHCHTFDFLADDWRQEYYTEVYRPRTGLVDSYKQRTINPHTEIPLFLWIGLTYIRGSWSWTDGTELNFLPWSLYTPNNAKNDGTRYCTHIWTATPFCPSCGQRYYWNDIKCTYKMRYACKKPHTDDTTSSEENQQKPAAYECQGGWSLLPGENSCVKVVHTPENWQQANVNCKQIGSELASVHNMEDNIFITRLVDSFVKQAMDPRTNGKTEMLWIGLRFSDNSWFWSDGKPLNFSAWSVSRPNNAMNDGKEYCGHIWPADAPHFGQRYYWNDELCSYKMRYACKQPASLKVKCKTDWLPLNGTTTCIENRRTPTKNNRELLENNLRAKCVGLPKKSYFDPATWTCFVDSSDCDFVQFPSDRYKRVDVSRVRGELEKRKIRTDSSKICAFVPTYRCGNKIVSNGNSCFWLTEKEDSWSGASNDCQKKGGNLFVPHNDGDMQVALDYLTATGAESSAVWVGLVLTDKWIAVDSSEVNYLRWTSSVETYSTKAALGSLFLHDEMSKTDGSYAAYIRLEKESSKFFGLCRQPLI